MWKPLLIVPTVSSFTAGFLSFLFPPCYRHKNQQPTERQTMLNTSLVDMVAKQVRSKMIKGLFYVGIALIVIALMLGGVQDLRVYSIYGSGDNKWYFYSFIGIVLLIGLALVVWSHLKRQKPQK
jgi:hypothetical protein